MSPDQSALLARLVKLESGQLSDVLDEAGFPNHALSPAIGALAATGRMAGFAITARGERSGSDRRPAMGDLDAAICDGSVVVIDTGGYQEGSCLGGLMAYSFQRSGCRGFVVDGLVRDADEIQQSGLPVFCRGTTPINGARGWMLVEVERPISLPGARNEPVSISPGDFVVGDADGIVVIPASAVESIVADAEMLAKIEGRIGAALREGATRREAFASNPRFTHVRKLI